MSNRKTIKPKKDENRSAELLSILKRENEDLREEINRLKAMVDSSPIALTETDLRGNIIACNRTAAELTGHSNKEELIGESAFAMIAPEDRQRAQYNLETTLREGQVENKEYTIQKKDGSEMVVELSARLVRDEKGQPVSFIAVTNDVTSRKKMEAALARSARLNEKLRILMARLQHLLYHRRNAVPDPRYDPRGFRNGRWWRLSRRGRSCSPSLLPQPAGRLRSGSESHATFDSTVQEVMRSDVPVNVVDLSKEYSGTSAKARASTRSTVCALRDGNEVIGFLNVTSTHSDPLPLDTVESLKTVALEFESIFKRLRAEVALIRSEEMFRSVVESSPMGMHLYRLEENDRLVFVGANTAADRLLGIDHSQIVGRTIEEAFPPLRDTQVPRRYRRAAADGESWHTEQIDYEDERIKGAFEVHAFQTTPGNVAVMFLEITSRKRAEEALKDSEEKYRQLVENINDVIFTADVRGTLTYVSPAVASVTGYEASEMVGRSIFDFVHAEDVAQIRETLARRLAGNYDPVEYRLRTRSDKIKWVRSSSRLLTKGARVLGIQGILSDITESTTAEKEKKHLETQLRQAQKMEAIGQLAGGVAHDFNNLLSPILGYSELLLMDLHPDDPRYGIVAEIRKAGNRAKDLTRQLLAFGRKQLIETQSLDLGEVTRSFERMLRRTIREDVTIELKLAPSLGAVEADRSQIEQILMNLAVNAQDAMPGGGTMTIETGEIEVNRRSHSGKPRPGRRDLCDVSDPRHRHRYRQGFASTHLRAFLYDQRKRQGHRSRVGDRLRDRQTARRRHLVVNSKPGKGSSFRILLPRSSELMPRRRS